MNGKNAPAIFASALAALLMMLMLLILAGLAFAGLPTVYHPAGDIMPGNFSEGGYSFPNASRVGIGTPSPGYTLDVIGNVGSQYHGLSGLAGGNGIFIEATDGSAGYGSRLRYGGNGTNADTFQIQGVGNAVKLHISPQGNVGIGTISSDAKLTIQSAATGSGLHIRAAENPPDYMLKVEDQDGSVQGMYIDDLGRVGIGTTTPNATLQINKTGAVTNSCGGNWINDASAIMFRQNPGGGCGDDAYIAYYTTAADKTVLEIAARNDGPPIQDDIALMPGGGVGIGMTNPSTALHIAENNQEAELIIGSQLSTTYGSRAGIQVGNTDDHSSVMLGQSASNFVNLVWVYNAIPANAYAALGTMGGNNLILQNVAGNVGIGTNPDAKLTIQSAATGSGLHIRAGENEPDYIMKVEDQDGSVQAMYITTNGNLGIGTTSPGNILSVVQNSATDPIADSWTVYSSREYKTNITALSDEELAEILGKTVETKLYRYTFKNDSTGKVKLGIIAEESPAQILAEGGKAESVNEYVAFLHAAIKAQHKEMEDLKTANEELKQRVTRLEEKG